MHRPGTCDLPPGPAGPRKGAAVGLIRTALIFGAGYAVGDPKTRHQLVSGANQLAQRPEVRELRERGREAVTRVTGRRSPDRGQDTGATESTGAARTEPEAAGAVRDPSTAPDANSPAFLEGQNPVEKVSPKTSADAPATEAGLIPTDPAPSEGRPGT